MRFRLGLGIGFGVGYYLGARAGRERYEQMRRWIRRAKDSEVMEVAADKASALLELGVERARDLVERETDEEARTGAAVTGGNGSAASDPTAPPSMPL